MPAKSVLQLYHGASLIKRMRFHHFVFPALPPLCTLFRAIRVFRFGRGFPHPQTFHISLYSEEKRSVMKKSVAEILLMQEAWPVLERRLRWTLLLVRNVIFPTVLIARDVISNSRQSTEIYRRYLTWFRFIVRRVVRRGVICDHNSPLNIALLDACAGLPVFSSSPLPRCRPSAASRFSSRPQTSAIYEHIFHVSRGELLPGIDSRTCSAGETNSNFTL